MNDKIELAIEYSVAHGNTEESKNDAANIFATNYDEYMAIWKVIENL